MHAHRPLEAATAVPATVLAVAAAVANGAPFDDAALYARVVRFVGQTRNCSMRALMDKFKRPLVTGALARARCVVG